MVRNVLGILLGFAGAAAAVWSPFSVWYGSRLGRAYRVDELFTSAGITGAQAGLWVGLFAPMLGAAAFTVLAALLRSRLLMTLAGLIVLGTTGLWMVRQGQQAGTLTTGAGGLGAGVGYAVGGGALLLTAALVLRGRRRGRRRRGRARVDDGNGATAGTARPAGAVGPEEQEHPGPPRYDDDSTPPEEWDPWAAGRPKPPPDSGQPPQGPQQQPPPPPPGP